MGEHEDALVEEYLEHSEQLIRGIIRSSDRDSEKYCAAYAGEDRCFAAISCGECRLRIFMADGSDAE